MARLGIGSAVGAYFVKLASMPHKHGSGMELRHLRYFVAVAEAGTDVDARSLADLAGRTAQHRRDDFESILAAARECPCEGNRRCSFSSKGKRGAGVGVPSSRQGALGGGLA